MSNATDIRQSGGTAGSVDHTDTSLAVSRTIPVPPTDTLYRAALTFCLDGADVMMYAALKGAENAESLWHALAQSHPSQPSEICGPALSRIDRMFVDGLTRWGRKASANAMRSFRNALAGWHNRMMDLPSQDIIQLADWFTMDGTQWIIGPGHPCWPSQLADLSIRSDWAPPLCLWIKGDPRALTSCAKPVGIVGSRDVTEYGRYVAH
ncbi:DNA-processing protein DprA, partial [Bifidobacterium longum]